MSPLIVAFRRTVLLVVVAAVVGTVVSRRRGSRSIPEPRSAPVWPPLDTTPNNTTPIVADPPPISEAAWLPPNADGSLPDGHLVKAKDSSKIFHVPGGRFYDRTTPDRCYRSAVDAEADGYRRSKT